MVKRWIGGGGRGDEISLDGCSVGAVLQIPARSMLDGFKITMPKLNCVSSLSNNVVVPESRLIVSGVLDILVGRDKRANEDVYVVRNVNISIY